MKSILTILLGLACLVAVGQSVVGTWQVAKESNCLGNELSNPSETETDLAKDMASLSGAVPKTMQFNADNSGEQNWKSVGKRKPSSKEKFLYKADAESIYILDKKSRLITDTFVIEILTADSLVVFNKERSCERLEFVRVK